MQCPARLSTILIYAMLAACSESDTPPPFEPQDIPVPAAVPAKGPRISGSESTGLMLTWMEPGDDHTTLKYSSYQLGATGAIAAILTAAPGPSVRLWNAVIEQDWKTSLDLHERLMPLRDAIGVDNMPSLIKYAQQLQDVNSG